MICEHCMSPVLAPTMRDLGELGAAVLCTACWGALLLAVAHHSWQTLTAYAHAGAEPQCPSVYVFEVGMVEGQETGVLLDPLRGAPVELGAAA